MSSKESAVNFFSYFYPIVTACLGMFVTFSGYCVYNQSKQAVGRTHCTYELFEAHLIKILHREASKSSNYLKLCQLSTPTERKDFFLNRIHKAYKCITHEQQERGINYIIQAMAICAKPAAILQCLSKCLPKEVYLKLITKLSELS